MRQLSEENKPFSFVFMSFDETRGISKGIKHVHKARLRLSSNSEQAKADMFLNYIDLETMDPRRFHKPLLMFFNGEKCELT